MQSLKKYEGISPFDLKENIFDLLDNRWMLITAGSEQHFNTMTASWGGFGILWNKTVSFIFIRPQRYTHKFVESKDTFTLSFFSEKYRSVLNFCGSKSGRDYNKPKEAGLTPVITPNNSIAFGEASLILDCRKIYSDVIKNDHFIDSSIIDKVYPAKDFHTLYIGEITECYLTDNQ